MKSTRARLNLIIITEHTAIHTVHATSDVMDSSSSPYSSVEEATIHNNYTTQYNNYFLAQIDLHAQVSDHKN